MTVISGMTNLLTGSIARIEQKVDNNQQSIREMAQNLGVLADKLGVLADKLVVQKEDFDRRLEMMKSKQEMVLLKQDQLQSTLHGETGVQETPPVFTTPPPLTPRLSLSTHSIQRLLLLWKVATWKACSATFRHGQLLKYFCSHHPK